MDKTMQESSKAAGSFHLSEKPAAKIFGYDISHFSQTRQFFICSIGVLAFFILYGYTLELIFIKKELKQYGLYLTFFQFTIYSVFSFVEFWIIEKNRRRKIPIKTYLLLAFLTVSTMALSNSSLGYLNFPTQVIFKSCKLIPVLVGGILIQKKRYRATDFFAALVMCVGLVWFTLADSQTSPNFNSTGIILISLALVADAAIGNVTEKMMKLYGATNSEIVFYSYSFGLGYLAIMLIITEQLIPSIRVSLQYPLEMYFYGFVVSVTGYLGVNIILTLTRTCGAFATVTVTSFRKSLTVALSFLLFAKPFTWQYVFSGLLVLTGVYLNLAGKQTFPWWRKDLLFNNNNMLAIETKKRQSSYNV